MDVTKHTAPKLEAYGSYVLALSGDTTTQVADCSMHRHGADYARLFAASIDLLAALRVMADTCKPTLADLPNLHPSLKAEPEYRAYFMAREAIAKAEGRTS